MRSWQVRRFERPAPVSGSPDGQGKWLSTLGVMVRYLAAVPFLALGAALLTIGALIAGNSRPHRMSAGRAQPGPDGETC